MSTEINLKASDTELEQIKNGLLSSFTLFIKTFYKIRTGREFVIYQPPDRESHFFTIARELVKCFKLEETKVMVNVPPGLGKSTILKYFIAWSYAHYPDCNFLYISFSHSLASQHTYDVRAIMSLKEYKYIFQDTVISRDASAKDNLITTAGGKIKAFGAKGSITGHDAGIPHVDRFSGANIIDDIHKPSEIHSELQREKVERQYYETIQPRARSVKVPTFVLGQRLHTDDLYGKLERGEDGYKWKVVKIKALSDSQTSIYPEIYPVSKLLIEKEYNNYYFNSQLQQDPASADNSLYKRDDFIIMYDEPELISTFITIDTAETSKTYNDATAFSFWGVYKSDNPALQHTFCLHWIDCWEVRLEPKDLHAEFFNFYNKCMSHKIKPALVAIEKKNTGTTIVNYIKHLQGYNALEINRTSKDGSKIDRFISMQKIIALKQISFTKNDAHVENCIKHMCKISSSNSHAHDDICDTVFDAVDLAIFKKLKVLTGFSAKTEPVGSAYGRLDRDARHRQDLSTSIFNWNN